jgi:O-antigen/teichoic acid export membrane protein
METINKITGSGVWYKLTRNTLSNLVGIVIPVGIGFFLMPFIIKHIGIAGFGIWLLAGSVIGYMGLINLGLGPTVTKKSAEYIASESSSDLNRMLSTTFFVYLCLGLIAGIIIFLLGFFLPNIFKIEPEKVQQFKVILWLIGLQLTLGFPFAIFGGLMQGLQDFHASNVITIINTILRLIGTVLLLASGFGLISLVVLELFISLLTWLGQIVWVKHRIPNLKLSFDFFQFSLLKELFKFSLAMFLWRFAAITIHRANKIIIGIFLPLASITFYEVANKILEHSRMSFIIFLSPLLPASSELEAQRESPLLRELYLKGTKFVICLYSGIAIVLFLCGDIFINLWMGSMFRSSVTIMYILLIGNIFQSQNVVAHVMLPGIGVLKQFTLVMALYPLVNVLFSIVLIQSLDLQGIAWAYVLSVFTLETYLMIQSLRIFRVSFYELFRTCHLPSMMSLIPVVIVGYNLRKEYLIDSWLKLTVEITFLLVIYGLTYWILGLSKEEKTAVKRLYSHILGRTRFVIQG